MKKLGAILFLSVFLCANTEIGQLLKLPALLHHFIEHNRTKGPISFVQFIHEHYEEEDAKNPAGHNEHERLPFKSLDSNFSLSICACQPPFGTEIKTEIPVQLNMVAGLRNVAFNASSHLAKIWQPPRTC